MIRILEILSAIVGLTCVGYLLLNPMERNSFAPTRLLGRWLFPGLSRDQCLKRLAFLAGVTLSLLVIGDILAVIMIRAGKR